jgi:hypothetical protein
MSSNTVRAIVTGMLYVVDMWVCIEQERGGVMLGLVNTLSPLFLVIGANNTHYCINLMSSTFTIYNELKATWIKF